MFGKWMQYSYAAQKHQRHRYLKFFLVFFILFLIYNALVTFVISVWVLDNNTMQPGLASGDRILFTSLMMPARDDSETLPFKRGSVVLVDRGNFRNRNIPMRFLDTIVRFFTAQRHSIFADQGQYYLKRVIALPGDEVYMNNFVFRVRPAESPFSLTEFELSERAYQPAIPQVPAVWDESIPFSRNMDAVVLGPQEIFVVSDDRSNTNDSRTWGPIPPSAVTGRALLRFWPVLRLSIF